jgi:thiamine biosynthesis lipoprotein
MGMPITVVIEDETASQSDVDAAFNRFQEIDERYSPYKSTSEVSRINNGLEETKWSKEMKHIVRLCRETTRATDGYFDAFYDIAFDPSGLVKGWAIADVARLLKERHLTNFYIDAGGDIQVSGANSKKQPWRVGIRNPMNHEEIVKVVAVTSEGVATSGTYIRGNHIYNPITHQPADTIASLTIIGPDIYEADRFATAAFAMGPKGIQFIESLKGFEAYMIDNNQIATFTSGFERYIVS